MSRRGLGIGVIVAGLIMIGIGVAGLGGSPDATIEAAPSTSQPAVATTVAAPPATEPPSTTTTLAATTTTRLPATTTTSPAPPSIEDFVASYAAATETGDAEFLVTSLFPDLLDAFGADTCRTWIDDEILALSGYRLTGDVTGPFARSLQVGGNSIEVDEYYEAPVAFTFQGQSFDAVATFVVVDGVVHWLGECR